MWGKLQNRSYATKSWFVLYSCIMLYVRKSQTKYVQGLQLNFRCVFIPANVDESKYKKEKMRNKRHWIRGVLIGFTKFVSWFTVFIFFFYKSTISEQIFILPSVHVINFLILTWICTNSTLTHITGNCRLFFIRFYFLPISLIVSFSFALAFELFSQN